MGHNHGSIKHKLGNVINGVLKIFEGIVLVISLGNYQPDFSLDWNIYRRRNKFFCDVPDSY